MKTTKFENENLLIQYRARSVSEAIEEARKADARHYFRKYRRDLRSRECPVCGSAKGSAVEPYAGSFNIDECNRCRTTYVNPVPSKALLDDYYQNAPSVRLLSEFYARRDLSSNQFISDSRIEKAVESMKRNGLTKVAVLEVGCNEGRFLRTLQERAKLEQIEVAAFGIEPNVEAQRRAIQNGLNVKCFFIGETPIADYFSCGFDYVFCFELLEHLIDPFGFLTEVKECLVPNGQVHLTTPNSLGFENLLTGYNGYRQLAHAIAPPAHLNAFNTQNITHLGLRCNLSIKSIEAVGRFDSYALQEYNMNAKKDLRIVNSDRLAAIDSIVLQDLINTLNASSTMHVVMSNE